MEPAPDLVPLLRLRDVDGPFLRVVRKGRPGWDPGAYDRAGHIDSVVVVGLDPVVVLDAHALGVPVVEPDGVTAP